jgi:hypothetical protein
MTDREQLCREFTELTGVHWHEWTEYQGNKCKCGLFRYRGTDNPTYDNPADVLRVMALRNDYDAFTRGFLQREQWLLIEEFIEKYILEPDSLLKAAVGFLKEGKK